LLLIVFFFSCGDSSKKLTENVDIKNSSSVIKLNIDYLSPGISKQETRQLILELPDGSSVTVERSRTETREEGFSWFGKVIDKKNSSVIITVEKGVAYGTVIFNGKRYRIKPLKPEENLYLIEDLSGKKIVPLKEDTVPFYPEKKIEDIKALGSNPEDGSRVDILVLYTTAVKNEYGTGLEAFIRSLIDIANQSFINSNINTSLNLAGISEITSVDETVSLDSALNTLSSDQNIDSLRKLKKADIVVLLRKYQGGNTCGLGYIIVNLPDNFDQNLSYYTSSYYSSGFSVVEVGNYGSYYCPDETFAHEVGHNFGCSHDRDHSTGSGAFSYSYGYDVQGVFATVMSYDRPTIRYFSNPNITYKGYSIGVPEGQPDSADNSKTINRTRLIVANYISVPSSNPPVINSFTADPISGKVPLTVSFNWNVSDPDGDSLRCNFDADGDGTDDITVTDCSTYTYSYEYTSGGSYTPKLSVSDGIYITTKTLSITVNQNRPPSGSFSADRTVIYEGDTVKFSYSASDPDGDNLICLIDLDGNGNYEIRDNGCNSSPVNRVYNIPGTYIAELVIDDGYDTVSYKINIQVKQKNSPPETPSISGVTSGYTDIVYPFTASSKDPDGDSIYYRFDWGDGNVSDWGSGRRGYQWDTPRRYCVRAQAKDDLDNLSNWSDCFYTDIVLSSTVNSPPDILIFESDITEGYLPLTVTFRFKAGDKDGDPLVCNFDSDGDNSFEFTSDNCGEETVNFTYTQPGEYTAVLEVSDGKDTVKKSLVIKVYSSNNDPVVDLFSVDPFKLLEGDKITVRYKAHDPDGDSIECLIDFGDGTYISDYGCSNQKVEKYYKEPGEYVITLTVKDTNGNDISQKITVTVNPVIDGGKGGSGCSFSDNDHFYTFFLIISVILIRILKIYREERWEVF